MNGSEQDVWKKILMQKIKVDFDRCLGEGNCVRACPFMVFEIKKIKKGKETKKVSIPVHQKDCYLCQSCQARCPTNAITIEW